jgi:hypothetical protein
MAAFLDSLMQGPEEKPVSDQNLPPFVIVDDSGAPVGTVQDNDAGGCHVHVLADRSPHELTEAPLASPPLCVLNLCILLTP